MTIIIETTCRACGETFTPSSADIRRGVWRTCQPNHDPTFPWKSWVRDSIQQRDADREAGGAA